MTVAIETRPAVHSTFRLERYYEASPARVFLAFADTAAKRRWLVEGEGFEVFEHEADFRVGGREFSRFRFGEGPQITNEAIYQDIVPNERIIFCYRMAMGGLPMSASLTTIELTPQGSGTLLIHTEQGAYLDGLDDGTGREEGTRGLLEILAKEVEG
jgi:uncharacterized protein YndB with AHSA1/START domain